MTAICIGNTVLIRILCANAITAFAAFPAYFCGTDIFGTKIRKMRTLRDSDSVFVCN